MTVNPKRIGQYLQSLVITALVAGLLPVLLMGGLMLALDIIQEFSLWPLADLNEPGHHSVIHVLTILGSGNPRQGVITIGVTSSLVGMLFDTYAFCSHLGLAHRSESVVSGD